MNSASTLPRGKREFKPRENAARADVASVPLRYRCAFKKRARLNPRAWSRSSLVTR